MRIAARAVLALALAVATCPLSACTTPVNPYPGNSAARLGTSGSYSASSSAPYSSTPVSGPSYSAGKSAAGAHASPSGSDAEQASELTNYFQHNRLPLVGAKITRDSSGRRQVVLYGFTATAFGKNDAVDKTREFLNDPAATIDNRIIVRPELANAAPSSTGSSEGSAPSAASTSLPPGAQAYVNQNDQQNQVAQYQQQNSAASMSTLVPLLGLAVMLGASMLGGSSGGYYPSYPSYPGYPGYGPYGGSGFSFGGGFP